MVVKGVAEVEGVMEGICHDESEGFDVAIEGQFGLSFQIEDWVASQLTRSMVGGPSTTSRLNQQRRRGMRDFVI